MQTYIDIVGPELWRETVELNRQYFELKTGLELEVKNRKLEQNKIVIQDDHVGFNHPVKNLGWTVPPDQSVDYCSELEASPQLLAAMGSQQTVDEPPSTSEIVPPTAWPCVIQ